MKIKKLALPTIYIVVALVQIALLAAAILYIIPRTEPDRATPANTDEVESADITGEDIEKNFPNKTDYDISFINSEFFELQPTINGQVTYIAHPSKYSEDEPLKIVAYSHGSITFVTRDFSDPFMQDLREYAEFFTSKGYIFAASNQHGENWGNQDSIDDTKIMVDWIKQRFDTQAKIDMIGFSMGGLPTMHFAFQNPSYVDKIALLAPTSRPELWTQEQYSRIFDSKIKIWHGTADVNIGSTLSQQFYDSITKTHKSTELVLIDGYTHWDMEEELKDDIVQFFLTK